jgi:hypothetical protein
MKEMENFLEDIKNINPNLNMEIIKASFENPVNPTWFILLKLLKF